jgi:hypothetical protein
VNLIGSRATLNANLCALVSASIQTVEGAFIVHECLGYYLPQDTWAFFTPTVVMFIIRNRIFSYCFVALHIALSIQMFFQARSVYLGTYVNADQKFGPLSFLPIFFVVSAVCLAIYAADALIRFAISQFASQPPVPIGDDPPDWSPR